MKNEDIAIQEKMKNEGLSASGKYSSLIVGKPGLLNILKYDFITSFASTSGALGLALRKWLFPKLFKKCGKNVIFGKNITIRHPNKIEIGDNVTIDQNCLIDAKGEDNTGIKIGNGCFVGRNSILSCKNGNISLGENVNIGFNAEVVSLSNVDIGTNTMLAAYSYIIGGGHKSDTELPLLEQERCSKGIKIGDDVWIGAGAKVMDGTAIGSHSIIGANAVVTRDIPEYSVAVGIPANVTRDRRDKQ